MDGGITGGVEAFNKKGKKKRKTEVLRFFIWSGKRGSNSRPQPWQGCALPLSYSRRSLSISSV